MPMRQPVSYISTVVIVEKIIQEADKISAPLSSGNRPGFDKAPLFKSLQGRILNRLLARRGLIEPEDFLRGFTALQQIEHLRYPLSFTPCFAPQFGFINCRQQYVVYHLMYLLKFRISFIQSLLQNPSTQEALQIFDRGEANRCGHKYA
jgi:hypothetical protein